MEQRLERLLSLMLWHVWIKPGSKIITIEETAELNLPHENWVSLIARRSYGLGENLTGEVTLFDLVKTSMRHRPDLIVVGEIRGSEAYTLSLIHISEPTRPY